MQPKDRAYIWDMIQAAHDILEFTKAIEYKEFETNKLIRFSVERQLLVIGEAAHHLSVEARGSCGVIAWKELIGLRNVLAHEYGEILTEKVWIAAKKEIPKLLTLLKTISLE